ncbi:molybdopterin-dependent oxidoreductase [Rhodococcus pyridinivorans]|uniref:molybdopterin-dependent oxidoreductase n=1 Tax=Rhodococcus pyridinivorans TaxID=103816 RepID=UPI0022843D7F|nr:molybdopterin-dependent oxidoreductase [Rhodococcus pyridinivorans]WAL46059.1 molybdopterin-dependent oxidoreductase [Rhodococcus pyridinivorans]
MPTETSARTVKPRICPLCEATCGLLFELDGRTVTSVRANPDDVFSAGHSCAKGVGLAALENDPDVVRTPLIRDGDGFRTASWDEAFAEIERRLPPIVARDPNSCAVYSGNPAAHHLDPSLYTLPLIAAIGTRNVYSPASIDTLPKNFVNTLLYGTGLGMAIPDIDRTSYLLILGSNPLVSNGSTITAPGIGKRLEALRERGGTLVVVDPARTRTAEVADLHLPIRPGADALFLLALVSVIAEENLAALGRLADHVDGVEDVLHLAAPFTPEAVADTCGLDAGLIRQVARDFAAAPAAVAHSRMGSCTQEFGSVANWMVEVLNIVTGNLDRPGGAMFPTPPAGGPTTWPANPKAPLVFDRWRSRVRDMPEAMGEIPAVCFAEEILTPGPGQVRALITISGNPARSVPNSRAVETALADLEFMVCIDGYLNETTRYADVVLPPPPLTTRGHHDLALTHFQVRNVARYSAPLLEPGPGEMPEWQILLRLTAIVRGEPGRPISELDDEVAATAIRRAAKLAACEPEHVAASVSARTGPERLLDLRLRSGPYGDRFGTVPDGLTLELLERHPEGIDYGPMQPRIPEVLRTPNGRIDLVPDRLTVDIPRVRAALEQPVPELLLINRRQRRGMNSWLHNALPQPDSGQCALFVNDADARERGLVDGDTVRITSKTGSILGEVRITAEVRPGVVSLPHGWGHQGDGLGITRAASAPGSNVNALVDDSVVEPLTGAPIFNGIPVDVERAEAGPR